MSESRTLLVDTAERLFAGDAGWPLLEESGLAGLLVPEQAGGFGGDWGDAFAVIRLGGYHAVSAPVGEAILASWLAARAQLAAQPGLVALAAACDGALDARGRFTGRLAAPAGADAAHVVAEVAGSLVRVAVAAARETRRGANPAGDARDTLQFEAAPAETGPLAMPVQEAGAFVRTAQIAGALDRALQLSIAHASERQQFGKPIGKFQAVQQNLALLAEEAAAVNSAGQAAARRLHIGEAGFEIAAARLRANLAVGVGVAVAHQTHGAIGFTREHTLQRLTRRLISWRSEFGGDHCWSGRLGAAVCARGADAFWPFLTARAGATKESSR